MATNPVQQHISFEQYLLLVSNSDRRYEYYDGEVRLMAGGSSNHATIALNFGVALDQALGDDAPCHPYVTDKLVRLTPTKTVIVPKSRAFSCVVLMELTAGRKAAVGMVRTPLDVAPVRCSVGRH